MKPFKFNILFIIILSALISLQQCEAQIIVQKPVLFNETTTLASTAQQTTQPGDPSQVDYNFSNIQFEFDSDVFKMEFYPVLDDIAREMKKDPNVKFEIKGYASEEGTNEHSLKLSQDRCNAVKAYLVKIGVNADNLIAMGCGESNIFVGSDKEPGTRLNRRVEIRVLLPNQDLFDLKNTQGVIIEP